MKSIRSAIMLVVALLVATLPASAQDCLGGQCAARVASAAVSVVTLPVRAVQVVSEAQPVRAVQVVSEAQPVRSTVASATRVLRRPILRCRRRG
jgi:hypothetical protein